MSESADTRALVAWGNGITEARLLHITPSVLLLEGERPSGAPLSPGAPVRVGLPGKARMVPARLAAFGPSGRYLVALGSRAVRGAARVRVDLPAVVRAGTPGSPIKAQVVDLSSSGARLRNLQLPVGSDCELCFVPPGRTDRVNLRCVVVRSIEDGDGEDHDVAVAFCGTALSFRVDLVARV